MYCRILFNPLCTAIYCLTLYVHYHILFYPSELNTNTKSRYTNPCPVCRHFLNMFSPRYITVCLQLRSTMHAVHTLRRASDEIYTVSEVSINGESTAGWKRYGDRRYMT